MIRYGSVCSGVEAASLAWEPLGWTPAWFSEIDPAASGVLAYHWPDVSNLGDMLELDASRCADIDVLVGGTPCQSFSVAGLRKGLDDERGNLTLSFVRLAETIDAIRGERGQPPITIVWENVPGVFSDSDNAFGCFLGALAGEDDPLEPPREGWTNAGCVFGPTRIVAWRVLNAQYFGVPQRRRRVFVVASAREGFDPREILFEPEGVRGNPAASGEEGEGITRDVVPSLVASGRGVARAGDFRGQDPVIPVAVAMRGRDGGAACELGGDVAYALRSADGGGSKPFVLAETSPTLCASGKAAGSATQQDAESGALIPTVFGGNKTSGPRDVATACNAHGGPKGRCDFESESFVVNARQDPITTKEITGPLDVFGNSHGITTNLRVRRLLPVECERLQGMPDGHTARTVDKELADGPRYKLIGNSMAVCVMAWLGQRIAGVLLKQLGSKP